MGAGIARSFIDHGYQVVLVDTDTAAVDRAVSRLSAGWQRAVHAGSVGESEVDERRERLQVSVKFEALSPCDLVVEAVFEDFDVKSEVLRRIESVVRDDAIIATNTSYLDLDDLAESLTRPPRLVGMHFFSPAHATKVLELVRRANCGAIEIATAVSVARTLGKTPIVSGVGFGFIGNRIFAAYRRQCELMVLEGALPDQVDRALEDFGFAMGPFAVADMSGLDIAWKMRKSRPPTGDAVIADRLCAAGRFGQKTGAGWYRYESGSTARQIDPEVEVLVVDTARDLGVVRRTMARPEIVRRALLAMVNEAANTVAEGIADHAEDIDVMMTLGYGFPSHQGGPVFWYREQDPAAIGDEIHAVADRLGQVSSELAGLAPQSGPNA
jgi:3-hydroxyacyl-CoA dehydrogenase